MKTILLKTHEVRAVLDGRKTMLRVKVKPQPQKENPGWFFPLGRNGCGNRYIEESPKFEGDFYADFAPFRPGDVLAVKETWTIDERGAIGSDPGYYYKADMPKEDVWKGFWKPSIHMPREACRLFLRIKSVRVERLQDISEEDAKAEGIEEIEGETGEMKYRSYHTTPEKQLVPCFPYVSFRTLWQKINGAESWSSNPWVWVVDFERIQNLNA